MQVYRFFTTSKLYSARGNQLTRGKKSIDENSTQLNFARSHSDEQGGTFLTSFDIYR